MAVSTLPSSPNSMIAWDLPMAAIWPSKSAVRCLSVVMSVAYLTTLKGVPAVSMMGL